MKLSDHIKLSICAAALSLAWAGCGPQEPATPSSRETGQAGGQETNTTPGGQPESEGQLQAVAVLSPTQGHNAKGTVTFKQGTDGVEITVDISGLEPGQHGFHIHENGDCSAPDGTSAGGHFNPTGKEHGAPGEEVRHIGDLGNIEADDSGHAHVTMTDSVISLEGEHSIIGKAVIVHGGADDLESQPSGAAGPRVACGVIEEGAGQSSSSGSSDQ